MATTGKVKKKPDELKKMGIFQRLKKTMDDANAKNKKAKSTMKKGGMVRKKGC